MFFGSFIYTFDEKNRLVIPKKFVSEINGTLYLLKGYDGCISLYKESEFVKLMEHITSMPFEDERVRANNRLILESVVDLNLDKANRILVNQGILNQYAIGKTVKIIGMNDHLEIWDLEKWQSYQEESSKKFEQNAMEMIHEK